MARAEDAMGKRLTAQQADFDRRFDQQQKDFEARQKRQDADFQRRLSSIGSGGGRRRSRTPRREYGSGSGSGGGGAPGSVGKGPQVCFDWLLGKCSETPCPHGRDHNCTEDRLEGIKKQFPKFKNVVFAELVCAPVE